jgi:hypothetical protein
VKVFDVYEPSLDEHTSAGVLVELWEKPWRCYSEQEVRETPTLIERFITVDALGPTIFGIKPTSTPAGIFHWVSENGVVHQGLLYANGAVYRQADRWSGKVVDLLLINEETAAGRYPDGWFRLTDIEADVKGAREQRRAMKDAGLL